MRQPCKLKLLGFLLAFALVFPAAWGTSATTPTPALPHDSLFSNSLADRGLLPTADPADSPADSEALLSLPGLTNDPSGDAADTAEVADAARHRNMAKFLLVILALGSVIRFVTSRAYLEFIADVLDPKAF